MMFRDIFSAVAHAYRGDTAAALNALQAASLQ